MWSTPENRELMVAAPHFSLFFFRPSQTFLVKARRIRLQNRRVRARSQSSKIRRGADRQTGRLEAVATTGMYICDRERGCINGLRGSRQFIDEHIGFLRQIESRCTGWKLAVRDNAAASGRYSPKWNCRQLIGPDELPAGGKFGQALTNIPGLHGVGANHERTRNGSK